jgi:hypothetical protein
MNRKMGMRVGALVTSVVVAFGLGEAVTRVAVADPWNQDAVPNTVKQYDPELGWSLVPDSGGVSEATGRRVEYRINSHGFRGREYDFRKEPGVVRVVLLGDSNTFGYGVPIDRHFSTLLEGYYENLEVINLGVSGYGIDQELLMLQSKGIHYAPDVVIAYVPHFGNYIRHARRSYMGTPKPWFESKGDALVLRGVPVPKPSTGGQSALVSVRRSLVRHSRLLYLLRTVTTQVRDGLGSTPGGVERSTETRHVVGEVDAVGVVSLSEKIVQEMERVAEAHGSEFLLVTWMDDLCEVASKQHVRCLSVKRALRNETYKLPNGLLHINESGNGVLARELQNFLDEHLATTLSLEFSRTQYKAFE